MKQIILATIVALVIGGQAYCQESEPPDWNLVIVAFTVMIGLLASKDADKSTEDHGL